MFSTTFSPPAPLPSSSSGIIVNSDCCIMGGGGGGGRGAIGGGTSATINSNSTPATVDNNSSGSRTMSCGINNVGIVTIKDPSSGVNNGGGCSREGGGGSDNRNSISNNTTSVCCCCGGGNCFARFFYCLLQLTRFWGVFAAVVLASVGIDLAYHKHQSGYYLIGESIFLFVLEVTWVVTLFLRICVRNDNRVWKFWKAITWMDGWRKSLLYTPMGAVPLLIPHQIWLSYVVAGQLFTLALFYGLLSFKGRHYRRRRRRRHKERLLHNSNCDIDSYESSKLEEITDILDDGLLVSHPPLPEPIPGSSHSLSDSLTNNCTEPDSVLEI